MAKKINSSPRTEYRHLFDSFLMSNECTQTLTMYTAISAHSVLELFDEDIVYEDLIYQNHFVGIGRIDAVLHSHIWVNRSVITSFHTLALVRVWSTCAVRRLLLFATFDDRPSLPKVPTKDEDLASEGLVNAMRSLRHSSIASSC